MGALKNQFRSRLLKYGKSIRLCVFAVVLFEILIACFDVDIFSLIVNKVLWLGGIGAFGAIITPIVEHLLQKNERNRNEKGATQPEKGLYGRAWTFVCDVFRTAKRSSVVSLLLVVLIHILVPSAVAHYRPFGHGINVLVEVVEQLRNVEEEITVSSVIVENEQTSGEGATSQNEPPKVDIPPEPNVQFLEEPDRYYELSEEEEDWLYFKSDIYKIEDWSDDAAVVAVVLSLVHEICSKNAPNEFDANAPPDIQWSVATVETDYDKMTSSKDLDNVINVQLIAWTDYPKYGLAWMLANNFQEYGDRYNEVDGYFETVEYYYGQAVFWTWRTLTYESAETYQVKECLRYISMRYHDIADIAPEGSQVKQRATALYRAFKSIQNNDFP